MTEPAATWDQQAPVPEAPVLEPEAPVSQSGAGLSTASAGWLLLGGVAVSLIASNIPTYVYVGLALLTVVIIDLVLGVYGVVRFQPVVSAGGIHATDEDVAVAIIACASTIPWGGRPSLVAYDPVGPLVVTDAASERGDVLLTTRWSRGGHGSLTLRVRWPSPLGLVQLRRTVVVPIGLTVGPASTPVGSVIPAATAPDREVVSIRPYQPRDPRRLVHWPTSARAGELMVRHAEPSTRTEVGDLVIAVEIGAEVDAAEATLERARAYAEAALTEGRRVELMTKSSGVIEPNLACERIALRLGLDPRICDLPTLARAAAAAGRERELATAVEGEVRAGAPSVVTSSREVVSRLAYVQPGTPAVGGRGAVFWVRADGDGWQ